MSISPRIIEAQPILVHNNNQSNRLNPNMQVHGDDYSEIKVNNVAPIDQSMEREALTNQHTGGQLCCPDCASCVAGSLACLCYCGYCCSLTQVNEREEIVLLNWGRYFSTIRKPGLYCLNPCGLTQKKVQTTIQSADISNLKVIDLKGSPVIVSGVVTFQVFDSKRAVIDVADWHSFIRTQSEVVLKQICSLHPYEAKDGHDSLKTEANKVRRDIMGLLQNKVATAGVKILSFEFNELSYAPEIAALMLVRQQAEAMLDSRKVVVEGAVSIANDAVHKLKASGIQIADAEASRLACNLVITITSESRVTPTINLGH